VRKFVRYALVGLLGLVVLGALALVSMISSLAGRHKPAIETQVSQALGVPVALGDIRVSVFPALRLRIDGLQIGASPASAGGMSAKALTLRVRIWPLLWRQLVVDTLRLEGPSATIVKSAAGVSIVGWVRDTQQASAPPGPTRARPPARPSAAPAEAAGAPSSLTIALQRIEIADGSFAFSDADTGRALALTDVDAAASLSLRDHTAEVSDLRIDGKLDKHHPVGIAGSSLVYDLRTGAAAMGRLTVELPGGSLVAVGKLDAATGSGTATLTSPGLRLRELAPLMALVLPVAGTLDAAGTVRPDLQATWKGPSVGIEGTVTLEAVSAQWGTWKVANLVGPLAVRVDPKRQVVRADEVSCTVNGSPARGGFVLTADATTARFDRLELDAFSGAVAGDATVSLAFGHPFGVRLTGTGLSIAEALAFANPGRPAAADGVLRVLALDARGRAEGHVTETLDGSGRVDVRDATLKGVNIGHAVLNATKGLPFLDGTLLALVPPGFRQHLSGNDTRIRSMTGDFSLRSGWAETRNLVVVSDLFSAAAAGRASTAMELALTATVAFDRELSQAMASSLGELRVLFDQQGRLSIPVKLRGQVPNVSVEPDLAALLRTAGVRGAAEGMLDKLLGGKKGAAGDLLDRLLPR